MRKNIHHMGMTITKEDHDRLHEQSPALEPEQHDAFMKKLGVTKEQDEEWHRTHLTLDQQRNQAPAGTKSINPFAVGGGFLGWCVRQGWLVQKGKRYFVNEEGERQLRERFGIEA